MPGFSWHLISEYFEGQQGNSRRRRRRRRLLFF
jgi:hypothetical protein